MSGDSGPWSFHKGEGQTMFFFHFLLYYLKTAWARATYYILAFPADIGRKPASPARRGSRQRLHTGESRLCRQHTPANDAADGTTW